MSGYDGYRPARWEHCVWQPIHVRNQITLRKIEQLNQLAMALMNQRPSDFKSAWAHLSASNEHPITEEQIKQLIHRGYNL